MEKREALKVWTLAAGHSDLLALADRHVPGALRRAHVGAHVRDRSDARRFHPCDPRAVSSAVASRSMPGARLNSNRAACSRRSRARARWCSTILFLTTACATVFVGTLYPLALEVLTGAKISVGAPFFNMTFGPLFMALLLAVPFGPLLAWKRGDLAGVAQRLIGAAAIALVGIAVTFALAGAGGSARAVRDWSCAVCHGRRRDGFHRAQRLPARAVQDRRGPVTRAAALISSARIGAFRAWHHAAWHCLRDELGYGADRRPAPRRNRFVAPIRSHLRWAHDARRAELQRAGRPLHSAQRHAGRLV